MSGMCNALTRTTRVERASEVFDDLAPGTVVVSAIALLFSFFYLRTTGDRCGQGWAGKSLENMDNTLIRGCNPRKLCEEWNP
jgi:hypothetical protein